MVTTTLWSRLLRVTNLPAHQDSASSRDDRNTRPSPLAGRPSGFLDPKPADLLGRILGHATCCQSPHAASKERPAAGTSAERATAVMDPAASTLVQAGRAETGSPRATDSPWNLAQQFPPPMALYSQSPVIVMGTKELAPP